MLTADEARQLDRLGTGASRAAATAAVSGLRHARVRGSGIEFQDYRHYQPGDDPRSIDWTVEARLQQLVVRVSRGEGHLRLHLLVDVSASMLTGSPDKLHAARKIAAALSYVALERRDAVGVTTFSEGLVAHVPPAAGRPQMFRIFATLREAAGSGRSAIHKALVDYASAVRGGGLVVVISDFFQPHDTTEALEYLLYRGFTPSVIQVVAADEVRPGVLGEEEIVDIEDASAAPIVIDAAAVASYLDRFARESSRLSEFCTRRGLPWLRVESSLPFEAQVHACVKAGLMSGPA